MALTAEQSTLMLSILGQLEADYAQLKAFHDDAWYVGSGSDSGEMALYVTRRMIDYLRTDMRNEVAAGIKTFAAWITFANDTSRTLKNANDNLPGTTWSSVTGAAVDDFQDTATKVGLGLGGIALVGGLIYLLAPSLILGFMSKRAARRT